MASDHDPRYTELMEVVSWKPIPASDGSTLAYLAEWPDFGPEDIEDIRRLLAPLNSDSKEIARALLVNAPLSPDARQVIQEVLGDLSNFSAEAKRSAEGLRQWGIRNSARR